MTDVMTDLDELEESSARLIRTLRALAPDGEQPGKRERASPPGHTKSRLNVRRCRLYKPLDIGRQFLDRVSLFVAVRPLVVDAAHAGLHVTQQLISDFGR